MPRRHYAAFACIWSIAAACAVAASAQTTTVGFAGAALTAIGSPPPLVSKPLAAGPVRRVNWAKVTTDERVLKSLRFAFIGVQALDVHSTFKAIGGGAREANVVMRPLVSSPPLCMLLKAGVTFLVYRSAERAEKRKDKKEFWFLLASDVAIGAIAIHNYRVAP